MTRAGDSQPGTCSLAFAPAAGASTAPGGGAHSAAKDRAADRRLGQSGPASASPMASPMCRDTGRTPSPITTTGPIRKAVCRRSRRGPPKTRAKSARPVASAIRGRTGAVPAVGARAAAGIPRAFHDPVKQEYIEPLARCAPAGVRSRSRGMAMRSASIPDTCCSCSIRALASSTSMASRICRRTSSCGTRIRAAAGKATR